MKMVQVIVFALAMANVAHAQPAKRLTLGEKIEACHQTMSLMPSEDGAAPVTMKGCLAFDFYVVEETPNFKIVEMQGQTVEDSTTVCTVYLLKDPTIEIHVPEAKCDLS